MKPVAVAAFLALLLIASGCGSAVAGAVWYFLPEEKDEEPVAQETIVEPDAPVVIIPTLSGVYSGDLDINYTLTDQDSDSVDVVIYFSLDSGANYTTAATESLDPRSEGTSALTSSPTGVNHLFVWDMLTDVGVGRVDTVRLRFTPSDSLTGAPAETADFVVDNTPPTVQIKEFTGVQSGEVTVAYRILDGASDLTDIEVEFSTDGGVSYWSATENTASSFTEGTTGLASSPGGTLHIFVWDSVADCAGYRCAPEEPLVRIRITPSDLLPGLPVSTEDFALDNNEPPAVAVQTPLTPPAKKGNVTITYTLSDPEADTCSISVLYSATSGLTWGQAIRGSGGDPVTGLSSSVTGTTHTYIWNSIANLGYCSETQVLIAIIPRDFKDGTGGLSDFFAVDNNLAPSASIMTPADVQSGSFYILYYLFDGGGDIIEIQADYSPDGGANWYPATLDAFAPEGTTPLASAPTGYPHIFQWDSDNPADMQGQYSDRVIFRIKPTDEYANEGEYAYTGEFAVSNNSAPSVIVASPPASPAQAGDIVLDYNLCDDESQDCDVVMEFSTDGGGTWLPATMASGSEPSTQRNSLPGGGAPHSFTWDSAADIDTLAEDVRFRMTPYDFPDRAGTPGITTAFVIDNSHWSPPVQVTSTGYNSINPAVHAAPDGTVHLVWQEYTFGDYSIYYSKKIGNFWSDPINISTAPRSCYYPDVVAGTDGTVHVVWFMADWEGDDQIHYRQYDGSKWLTTEQLTNSYQDVHLPSIALDENNDPWVVFAHINSANYNIYCMRHDGTDWLTPELIGYTNINYEFPTIRSGPDGSIMHVAYRRDRSDPCRIYYADHDGSAWTPVDIVYEYSGDYMWEPDVSVDSGGFVHIVWTRGDRAYYTTNASGTWSAPVDFSPSNIERPQVAAHSSTYVHTIWCLNSQDIYYKRFDGASWTTQEQVDLNGQIAKEPYMRRGLDGRIHLAYYEHDGTTWQIQYTSR